MYCLKVKASVYPNGEAAQWTKCYSGATSDISIFIANLQWHTKVTRKSPSALVEKDIWITLVIMRYVWIRDIFWVEDSIR